MKEGHPVTLRSNAPYTGNAPRGTRGGGGGGMGAKPQPPKPLQKGCTLSGSVVLRQVLPNFFC